MFTVPALPYDYTALEPFIDEATVHVHYDKHHQAYCTKLNAAVEGTEIAALSLDDIIKQANTLPKPVKNNGGGVWNHTFYWNIMGPGAKEPHGNAKAAIEKSFGSFDKFKEEFNATAVAIFGSGWAWLVKTADGGVEIVTTANQDNPMNENPNAELLLTCDVWEHAYYLKYKNLRPDYVQNFWSVVNWDAVEKIFNEGYKHN